MFGEGAEKGIVGPLIEGIQVAVGRHGESKLSMQDYDDVLFELASVVAYFEVIVVCFGLFLIGLY